MKLRIINEFDNLKSVVVCWGENVPNYEEYKTDDPEFTKYHPYRWDKNLLLRQQQDFFSLLAKYNVKLIFPKTSPHLLWQMYTRDTAFVVGQKLYFSNTRKLKARNGEMEKLLEALELSEEQKVFIDAEIEGGDVLVNDKQNVYVGKGSRTSEKAIKLLSKSIGVKKFDLGENVMHLDTRLTILPRNVALINVSAFNKDYLDFLSSRYDIVEISGKETEKLGTNVFNINPETVIVPKQHTRIAREIEAKGLKVEQIEYTEPINLGGSFRCTTLPIERAN